MIAALSAQILIFKMALFAVVCLGAESIDAGGAFCAFEPFAGCASGTDECLVVCYEHGRIGTFVAFALFGRCAVTAKDH